MNCVKFLVAPLRSIRYSHGRRVPNSGFFSRRLTHQCERNPRPAISVGPFGVFVLGLALAVAAPEKISAAPYFSDSPSPQEIFSCGAFTEPLVPVGAAASPREDAALADAIRKYAAIPGSVDFKPIVQFLDRYPRSSWRATLLLNLGFWYRQTGYFSRALNAYEEAWNLSKNIGDLPVRNLADEALAEFAELNSRLGRQDRLAALFQETRYRQLHGSALAKFNQAKTGLWMLRNEPSTSFRCGPLALCSILKSEHKPAGQFLDHAYSISRGTSLAQVAEWASNLGMDLVPARRSRGAAVIVACVVHWNVGHFGALTRVMPDGSYLLEDPTFGVETKVSADALDDEASGYFLVPAELLSKALGGWTKVSSKEAATVWGKGGVSGRDGNATMGQDHQTGGNLSNCGMSTYSVFSMLVSLHIMDTPLTYHVPYGPDPSITVSYTQLEANQPANFTFSNFGALWTMNWTSYIRIDQSSNALVRMRVAVPGSTRPVPLTLTPVSIVPLFKAKRPYTRSMLLHTSKMAGWFIRVLQSCGQFRKHLSAILPRFSRQLHKSEVRHRLEPERPSALSSD